VLPLIDRWIEREAAKYWQTCPPSSGLGPKAVDLYRRFGLFPIGDTGNPGGGTWPWWYHADDETERRWNENPSQWYDGYFRRAATGVARMAQIALDKNEKVTEHFPPRLSGESIVPIIESIACDIPRVFIVNIPNSKSFVPGVPHDFEVEIPALVSGRGIQGIETTGLPPALIDYILRDRVAPVNLELAAYDEGSADLLLQLILMDPWSRSVQQAEGLLAGIAALPYHEALRRHYQ
jgi:alpha-galactosidase